MNRARMLVVVLISLSAGFLLATKTREVTNAEMANSADAGSGYEINCSAGEGDSDIMIEDDPDIIFSEVSSSVAISTYGLDVPDPSSYPSGYSLDSTALVEYNPMDGGQRIIIFIHQTSSTSPYDVVFVEYTNSAYYELFGTEEDFDPLEAPPSEWAVGWELPSSGGYRILFSDSANLSESDLLKMACSMSTHVGALVGCD